MNPVAIARPVTMTIRSLLLAVLAAVAPLAVGQVAPVALKSTTAPATPRSEEGVRWLALTPRQREALGPLEREWPGIDSARKQKWVSIADRFQTLPPQERAHISERMTEWAKLTPAERGEVRMRYQEARQVPAPDRSARWQAYQKLQPSERQQFAARAASSAKPIPKGNETVAKQAIGREATQAKANVVPNPALAQPPRQVAPTIVQAAPGATTRFINRQPSPPAHQQSGMPKIAATPEFVNRSTLLPKRGPQAAGIGPSAPPGPKPAAVAAKPGKPASAASAPLPTIAPLPTTPR